jgi:hypothetical protein
MRWAHEAGANAAYWEQPGRAVNVTVTGKISEERTGDPVL